MDLESPGALPSRRKPPKHTATKASMTAMPTTGTITSMGPEKSSSNPSTVAAALKHGPPAAATSAVLLRHALKARPSCFAGFARLACDFEGGGGNNIFR